MQLENINDINRIKKAIRDVIYTKEFEYYKSLKHIVLDKFFDDKINDSEYKLALIKYEEKIYSVWQRNKLINVLFEYEDFDYCCKSFRNIENDSEIIKTIYNCIQKEIMEYYGEYTVYKEVFNIIPDFEMNYEGIRFYNYNMMKEIENEKMIFFNEWDKAEDKVFAQYKIKTANKYRALEILDEKMIAFTNLVRCFYPFKSNIEKCNFTGETITTKTIIFDVRGEYHTNLMRNDFVVHNIDITNPNIKDKIQLFLPIIFKTEKTDFDRRISNTVMWLGESINDDNKESALVKSTFALENLLGGEQKSNIAETLSTSAAIILSDELEERKKIKHKIKQIYTMRSQIVHGKSFGRNLTFINYSQDIVKELLIKIVTDINLSSLISKNKLNNYIEDKLFS